MSQLDGYDYLALLSCAYFFFIAWLHDVYGRKLYVFGDDVGIDGYDNWTCTTWKQQLIRGVFFVIMFTWMQQCIFTAGLILLGNPFGAWLGVMEIMFLFPQLGSISMTAVNPIGYTVYSCFIPHILIFSFWTFHKSSSGVVGFFMLLLAWGVGIALAFWTRYYQRPPGLQMGEPVNVAILRKTYAAFGAGDIPTVIAAMDSSMTWTEPACLPFGGTYKGPDAIVAGVFTKLGADWDVKVQVERFLDATEAPGPQGISSSASDVIVIGTYSGKYKATGKSFSAKFAHVWTMSRLKAIAYQQNTDTTEWCKAMQA